MTLITIKTSLEFASHLMDSIRKDIASKTIQRDSLSNEIKTLEEQLTSIQIQVSNPENQIVDKVEE